jgi:membrane protein DedA with SNARE-associated domain
MQYTILHSLRTFIADYGYWAVVLALLAESAGLPVPGEITLLLASFLAYSERHLHVGWIIVAGTCAATLGGNIGYAIGEYGGRPLLDRYRSALRISPDALERAEKMFADYGAAAILSARFIFGMRVFAGPLAGVLRMNWRAFTLFNFIGASVWVTFISGSGYLFGRHWHTLLRVLQRFNIAVLIVAAVVIAVLSWRYRRQALGKKG